MPSYITVRLNDIKNGTDCDQCLALNQDFSVELSTQHPAYCEWILDIGPGMEFYLRVTMGYDIVGNYYYCEVWLYLRDDACPDYRDNNLYWYDQQPTPYDCDNLNLELPLVDDEGPLGCNGGHCRLLS